MCVLFVFMCVTMCLQLFLCVFLWVLVRVSMWCFESFYICVSVFVFMTVCV